MRWCSNIYQYYRHQNTDIYLAAITWTHELRAAIIFAIIWVWANGREETKLQTNVGTRTDVNKMTSKKFRGYFDVRALKIKMKWQENSQNENCPQITRYNKSTKWSWKVAKVTQFLFHSSALNVDTDEHGSGKFSIFLVLCVFFFLRKDNNASGRQMKWFLFFFFFFATKNLSLPANTLQLCCRKENDIRRSFRFILFFIFARSFAQLLHSNTKSKYTKVSTSYFGLRQRKGDAVVFLPYFLFATFLYYYYYYIFFQCVFFSNKLLRIFVFVNMPMKQVKKGNETKRKEKKNAERIKMERKTVTLMENDTYYNNNPIPLCTLNLSILAATASFYCLFIPFLFHHWNRSSPIKCLHSAIFTGKKSQRRKKKIQKWHTHTPKMCSALNS